MRRTHVKRSLLTLVASILLFAALPLLSLYARWTGAAPTAAFSTNHPTVYGIVISPEQWRLMIVWTPESQSDGPYRDRRSIGAFGITGSVMETESGRTGGAILVPIWMLSALIAVLPAFSLRRHLRDRLHDHRVANGLCLGCGYDLRESRDRCPECGLSTHTIYLFGRLVGAARTAWTRLIAAIRHRPANAAIGNFRMST